MTLMTQRAYAKRKGVTPQYINKLVNRGVIRKVGRNIDSKQADAAIRRSSQAPERSKSLQRVKPSRRPKRERSATGPAAKPKGRTSATWNLTEAKAKRESFQAKLAELDYEKQIGNLLPREQVLEAERRKNANIRTMFRQLGRSLAPILARTVAEAEAERILLDGVDRILEKLAVDPLGLSDRPAPVPEAEISAPPIVPAPPAMEASL